MAIRIGFIGSGWISSAHCEALKEIEDVAFVAFADIQKERADAAAAKYGGAAYSDYHEMLDREKLDALYVCVPPFAHYDQEIITARKGIHLFIEKPIALNMDKAKEIRDAIHENGVIASVGYLARYSSSIETVKEMLAGREVAMILGYFMTSMPPTPWWRVLNESGGQMVEQTTHIFDLARYIAGDITEVYAAYGLRALQDVPNFDIWDVGTAAVKFANGAVGTIYNTCVLSAGQRVGLHVVCRDLVLEMKLDGSLTIIQPGKTETIEPRWYPIPAENQAFIKAIKTGDKSLIRSTYCDAMKTLAVTLAANESAATGKPVQVTIDG